MNNREIQLAKNCEILRKSRKLSREGMSKICDLSYSAIRGIEQGRTLGNLYSIMVLADFYGVTIDELVYSDFSDKDNYHDNYHDL